MRILLDADTLLEFLLNRSKFIGKVEYLAEIFGANSSIQLYLSKSGLDKIVSLQALNEKESEQLVTGLKKRIKILRVTKAVTKKARSSSAIDYESAVEIHLAIKANIGAIVTHKPSDFSSEELSIITLNDLQQRKHLEDNLSKNIKDLPAVFVINSEQISNLDKAFYHLPSYTGVKSLEPKESSHQLDLTCSSDKVSSPSGDNSSPRSTNARSLKQIIADGLLNQSAFDRLTARADLLKSDSLTGYRAYTSHVASLNESILQIGKAYSFITDSLSRQNELIQSVIKANNPILSDLAATCKAHSSLIDRLLPPPLVARSTAYTDVLKSDSFATTLQTLKNPLDEAIKGMLQTGKAYSSAVNNLSIKSISISRSTAQLESSRLSDLTTALQSYKSPFDNLRESMLQVSKPYSFIAESLSHQGEFLRPSGQFNASKLTTRDLSDAGRAYINPLDDSTESLLKANKPYSLLGGSLSRKSELLRSISRTDKKRMDDERSFFDKEKKRLDNERKSFFDKEKKRLDDERRFYSKQSNQLFKRFRTSQEIRHQTRNPLYLLHQWSRHLSSRYGDWSRRLYRSISHS